MLHCNEISKYYGERALFKDVSLNLLPKNRYAITGANGAGKSTFLKILAKEEELSDGSIEGKKGLKLGLLRQDHFKYENQAILDIVIEGKPALSKAFTEKEALLAKADITEEDCYRLADLEEIIADDDGYAAQAQAEIILQGLGLEITCFDKPLSVLSGGYKLRVLLAQALFSDPDVLLLDEPTNHLDIISISWLEKYLVSTFKGLLIFVSHDRSFINRVASHILDIDYADITLYTGDYDSSVKQKQELAEHKMHELKHKQDRIAELQQFADKFKAKATKSKQAMSRLKMIDKIELPDIQSTTMLRPTFAFEQKKKLGKQLLAVKGLAKTYGTHPLFEKLSLQLYSGQKYAIIGPNGVGKSTLIKIILGKVQQDAGEYTWNAAAKVSYFAQDYKEELDAKQDMFSWLTGQTQCSETDARKALGKMLFSNDDVYKKIGVLSGGECARLMFAKILLEQSNVLILDEPTNHLDMESIDGLIAGLKAYQGSVFFVSHNKFFIQTVATQLMVVLPKSVSLYLGKYKEYVAEMGEDYLETIYQGKKEQLSRQD
ncbi:MAG: ABC-F family ATPase [marine bacterium B5-7]|nr:MAG: ABC-F family ATPase [marine bacterium B5-7]